MSIPIAPTPTDGYEKDVTGWGMEAVEEGEAYVKAQKGYQKIQETLDVISSDDAEFRSGALSSTRSNHIAKIAGDLVALNTDIKPFWEYRTQNPKYEAQAVAYGKLSVHWYLQRQIDMRFAEVVRFWSIGGTGYAHQFWNTRTLDLDMNAEDPRDVLPIRPGSTHTLQDGMGVIMRRERTVNYLRQRYPNKANLIQADRDGSAATLGNAPGRVARLIENLGSPFSAYMARFGVVARTPRIPTCDEFTMYVDDDRRNETGKDHPVGTFTQDGKPANNWSYWVKPGDLLYPRKRCIVYTRSAVLYDGPSIYWHGQYPVSKLTLDPIPGSWLGKSPLWDLLPLQRSLDGLLRVVDDYMAKFARPDLIADKNSISRAAMDKIDTRRAGLKLQQNPVMGKGIQLVYPQGGLADVFNQIKFLIDEMDTLSGVRDMSQLMRLNQIPSSDSIDKIIESMTPLVRFRSRMIEAFMREFAMMLAYNFAQFYTAPLRLRILGVQGLTPQDFDYDPGSMIPDFMASDYNDDGILNPEALARGPLPRYDRAREFLRQFNFYIAPGSLLSASEIEKKLMYLQFSRAGLVDHWTLLEQWGVPNVGNPPPGANTITERLLAEQEMGLGMAISATGRKATGQEMPRIKVSES